ncbi:MAG: hypothetical protein ACOZBH_02120 [Patescibacteria group bacterium]
MRKFIFFLSIAAILFAASACSLTGIGIPEGKEAYIGRWTGDNTTMTIYDNGRIKYEEKIGTPTSLEAPIQEFTDEHITFGIFSFNKTIRIDRPPYLENDYWKMQIDGETLSKGMEIKLKPITQEDINQDLLDYLYNNVPEIKDAENRIMTYAEADVKLSMYIEAEPDPNSKNIYDRDYYRIYVGEDHQGTRQINVYRFLIHKDTREILYVDPITFEPITLEQWRTNK